MTVVRAKMTVVRSKITVYGKKPRNSKQKMNRALRRNTFQSFSTPPKAAPLPESHSRNTKPFTSSANIKTLQYFFSSRAKITTRQRTIASPPRHSRESGNLYLQRVKLSNIFLRHERSNYKAENDNLASTSKIKTLSKKSLT